MYIYLFQLEHTSEVLKTANTKTPSMKAIHNTTKSQRKQHRINLHENDVNNVNIQYLNILENKFLI